MFDVLGVRTTVLLIVYVVTLLAVLATYLYSIADGHASKALLDACPTTRRPLFRLPAEKRHHLQLLLRNLNDAHFAETGSGWSGVTNSHSWDLLWSFQSTQTSALSALEPHNRVNHVLGNYVVTMKQRLFQTHAEGRDEHGEQAFDFVVDHFLIPQDIEEFKLAFEEEATKQTEGFNWLIKSRDHGGVKVFNNNMDDLLNMQNGMVSKFIQPMLVGGRKWDVGIYVAITSLSPLRVYIYRNALIRVCKLDYPVPYVTPDSNPESYVIKDYAAPWENSDLKQYYQETPTEGRQGTFHTDALCRLMDNNPDARIHVGSRGDNCERWWAETKQAVVNTLLAGLPTFRKYSQAKSPHRNTFFELFRMDFNVDQNGKPWLVEVNMSPNLAPKVFRSGTDFEMKNAVVRSVLDMVAPHTPNDMPSPFDLRARKSFIHKDASPPSKTRTTCVALANVPFPKRLSAARISTEQLQCVAKILVGRSVTLDDAIVFQDTVGGDADSPVMRTWVVNSCGVCLAASELQVLGEFLFEHSRSGYFDLAYPVTKNFGQMGISKHNTVASKRVSTVGASVNREKPYDELLAWALGDADVPTLSHWLDHLDIPKQCTNRGDCSGHGKCIGGSCMCDTFYVGERCERVHNPSHDDLLGQVIDARPSQALPDWTFPFVAGIVVACIAIYLYDIVSRGTDRSRKNV